MIKPSKEEFIKKSKSGNLIPVVKEMIADFDVPISTFLKVQEGDYSFLLESVEGNERVGRYSFIGSNPQWVFLSKGRNIRWLEDGKIRTESTNQDPLEALRKRLQNYRPVADTSLPRFFGGIVGYVGYGMVAEFDGISQKNEDELDMPDSCFMLADTLIAFDHVEHRMKIIANAYIDSNHPEDAYEKALDKIKDIEQKLKRVPHLEVIEWDVPGDPTEELPVKSNFSKVQFEKIVEKAKEYIRAGDVFQVVLSQRFCVDKKLNSMSLYRALRSINPSPYMFLLKFKEFELVGTSPEILVRSEKGEVHVRPIAGTRPRGRSVDEDIANEKSLLEDPKECAEHIMLVDLGRNDLGRVSKYGSVRVSELMVVERYSHVMHIVSDVVGELDSGKDAFDVLRAAFPAGTVTGAPKIRAMQIIEELENVHRASYAGAIGYCSFSGDLDSCITIRTILLKNGKAYIQAGAGIVADSVPEKEYFETVNKAKAMMKAIALVDQT